MAYYFRPMFLILSSVSLYSGEAKTEMMSWGPRAAAKTNLAAMPTPTPEPEPCFVPCVEECLAHHFQIGGNYTYAHVTPQGLPSTSGSLGGAQALYEYRVPGRMYGGLAVAYREGNTNGSAGDRSILEIDVQERFGYTLYRLRSVWNLSLFTGFGYRHYGEKVSSTGSSITFNYNEFYVPVGFLLDRKMNSWLSMGLNFQWMPQVYPTVTIVPLKGARWIITDELVNFRLEFPLGVAFGCRRNFAITLQPFFEYWKDGHTTAVTPLGIALDVPGNTYLFGGVDLNFRYSF
jgi:hypothetical protein